MQGVQLRKYGVEFTVDFELYEVDGVDLRVDWVPAAADCEIMKDGGASTQCTNTATDEGSTYSIVITATEAQAARLVIKVVDAATKVFLDKVIVVETYGNASAQHAFDLDTANVTLADGAHGGSSAVLTLQNAVISGAATGLSISGTTAGMHIDGGTTGIGLDINGGSSSGVGVDIDATSGAAIDATTVSGFGCLFASVSGSGLKVESFTGPGMEIQGTTFGMDIGASAGPAISAVATGGNGDGMVLTADGSGLDLNAATTNGLQVDVVELGSIAQRATDLAEIAQYLIANSAEPLGTYVADDSLYAKMLAANGTVADYDDTTDSQEAIADTQVSLSDQISQIGSGGGSAENEFVIAAPNGFVITTGSSEVNDEDSTVAGDGTLHQISDTAGTMDVYYLFDIGGAFTPRNIIHDGRAMGSNDPLNVYVNTNTQASPTWVLRAVRPGQATTVNTRLTWPLSSGDVMTGADAGKVAVRFQNTGLTTATLSTDQILVEKGSLASLVGYANGAIWIDSAGTAGAVDYVNGVADKACPYANAKTINTSLALNRFHVANGNTLPLDAAATNWTVFGDAWTLALENQSMANAHFTGASVSGIATGAGVEFHDCTINTTTLATFRLTDCSIVGDLTMSATGNHQFFHCASGVPGAGAPTVDLGNGIGGQTVEFRYWSGGLTLTNIEAGDTVSVDGLTGGTLTLTVEGGTVEARGAGMKALVVNGTSGTVNVAGFFGVVTDNTAGAVTITKTWSMGTLLDSVTLADGPHGGSSSVLTLQSAVISGGAIGLDITGTTSALKLSGGTTGVGMDINGGSSSGIAIDVDTVSGVAITVNSADNNAVQFSAGGNASGLISSGSGSGTGIAAVGGMTGHGMALYSGPGGIGSGFSLIGPNDADIDITGTITGTIDTVTDVTNGVTLAADAIKAVTYDESTAFPVKSDDSGATQIARTGADGDTLETLSDQIDAISSSSAPSLLITTTIATLASQTSFTLTAGSADDNAYSNPPCVAIVTDSATATQKAIGYISDYTGATKTVTLGQDPSIFTMAAGDAISIVASHPYIDAAISSVVSSAGAGAIEWEVLVEDSSNNPLDGAEVWFTTDSAGTNIVGGTLNTDASGNATFMIDAGTYYFWKQLGGYNFTNPETVVVS